jgi:serine/threonine protein kinase
MAAGYTDAMQREQMGPYKLGSRLGRGGMGAVYEATDTSTGATVAVKLLAAHLADDSGLRKRFNSEIDTLKGLRHPGIVQLLAFGEEDEQPYFAMELVRGKSLEQLLRSGRRFTWQEAIAVALAVTRALKVAHDHGVIHRDLKPANLLVPGTPAADGSIAEGDFRLTDVKLADFGIARLFGATGHTAHGHIVGTAEYMAPEQASGKPLDHRADLYALGLVMFAMLAGRPPFQGKQVTDVIESQRREPPPRIAALVADVPPALDQLIDKLLAKDPAARPANALALGRLLSAIDAAAATNAASAITPAPEQPPQPKPATLADARPPAASVDLFAATQAHTPAPDAAKPASDSMLDDGIIWAQKPATGVDGGIAATQAFTGNRPHHTTQASVPGPGAQSAAQSVSPSSSTVVDRPARNRFTTVEELDKQARERAARDRNRQRFWQALTAVATVAAIGAGGYLLFKPLSADEIYKRIKQIQAQADTAGSEIDLRDARPSIELFLARHGADPRADEVKALEQSLDLDALEKRSRRRVLGNRVLSPIERDYRAAMDREAESPSACREALEALLALHASPATKPADASAAKTEDAELWFALVRRQIDRLEPLSAREQAEDAARTAAILEQADALATRAAALPDPAQREKALAERRTLLEGLIELYAKRPHAAKAVATAKERLAQ